jgi:hypothetical protein
MHVGASQSATQLLTPFSGNASTLEVLSPESAVVPNGRNTPQEIAYAADLSQQTQSFSTDQEPKRETPKTTLISGLKATNSSQALALSPLRQKYSSENLEDHNTDQIDEVEHNINEVLDVQFKNSGQEVWEDMRTVSRKVLQYATDILSTDPTPNGNSDDPSQASSLLPKLKPDTQSGIPIENPKSSAEPLVLDTKHGKIVTPPSQVKNMDLSLNEDGVHVSQHDNDRQRSPVAPPVSDRVTIKNIDGKSYQVPYASVREWEVSSDKGLQVTFA